MSEGSGPKIRIIEATDREVGKYLSKLEKFFSPFAPSGFNCLNFKLPVERSPPAESLSDVFRYP